MIAARKTSDIATAHRTRDVAAQHHRRDQSYLIDVVALLPAPHSSPGDLRRSVEHVECIGSDAARTSLMHGDAKVTELQLLIFADENIEWREIAMHRLATVQNVERTEDRGNFAPNEPLGLRTLL